MGYLSELELKSAEFEIRPLYDARELKPQIPVIGQGGIAIRDEIELEIILRERREARIVSLDHVRFTIPAGAEEAGRTFYCELLKLQEIEKPESLRGRGRFWLQVGDRPVHVGTEDCKILDNYLAISEANGKQK